MNYELPSFELRVIEENNYLKFGEYLNDMPCGNTINKLSLDDLQYVKKLQQENQSLKKQLENCYCNRTDCSGRIKDSKVYDSLFQKVENQQKEFIKYLENRIDICDGFLDTVKSDLQETPYGIISANEDITTRIKENETAHKVYEEILQKYKEIMENDTQ